MTNTIFCLSMPGGHMTYLALLTKLLLGHIPINYEYIDNKGSAHNFEKFLPKHLEYNFNTKWDDWFKNSIEKYTYKNVCVFKDGWASTNLDVWQDKLNSLENNICVISNPLTKVDWCYCWLNYEKKMPTGLYGQLKIKNILFPIWHMLSNKHKMKSFIKSMPVFPLKEELNLKCDYFRFPTTHILQDNFPICLHNFLIQHNFESILNENIQNFHNYFISKQKQNYELALQLDQNIRWNPRNMFDKILFEWLDTNPWEE